MAKDDTAQLLANLAQVDNNDPLRTQARNIIAKMLHETEQILKTGSPAVKATLIRASVPQLMRSLREERRESDEITEMREQLQVLHHMFRDSVLTRGLPIAGEEGELPLAQGVVEDEIPRPVGQKAPELRVPQTQKRGQ